MPRFPVLAAEVTKPAYAGMTAQEITDAINAVSLDNWIELTSAQVFEAIVPAEFAALTAANKARIDRILGLGAGIKTAPESNARNELIDVFGIGSQTIANLAAIANPGKSIAQDIGWGRATAEEVERARA